MDSVRAFETHGKADTHVLFHLLVHEEKFYTISCRLYRFETMIVLLEYVPAKHHQT